jgi:type IV pilus assembly protein PilV
MTVERLTRKNSPFQIPEESDMYHKHLNPPPQFQRGVSLIESMIALLVISVGILGIASLQMAALSQNSSAYWHTQAVLYAHNMADRIRANESEQLNYAGINTSKGYSQDCKSQACNAGDMINADAADWQEQVELLPAGIGIIESPVGGNQLNISVMWDDEGTGATGTDCGNNPEVDLTCYTITMEFSAAGP